MKKLIYVMLVVCLLVANASNVNAISPETNEYTQKGYTKVKVPIHKNRFYFTSMDKSSYFELPEGVTFDYFESTDRGLEYYFDVDILSKDIVDITLHITDWDSEDYFPSVMAQYPTKSDAERLIPEDIQQTPMGLNQIDGSESKYKYMLSHIAQMYYVQETYVVDTNSKHLYIIIVECQYKGDFGSSSLSEEEGKKLNSFCNQVYDNCVLRK